MDALNAKITQVGAKIKELKAAKAEKEAVDAHVAELLALKAEFKTLTGSEWKPAPVVVDSAVATAATPPQAPEKEKKAPNKYAVASLNKQAAAAKEGGGGGKAGSSKPEIAAPVGYVAPKGIMFYPNLHNNKDNHKVLLSAALAGVALPVDSSGLLPAVPRLPALSDKNGSVLRFGANAICRYLNEQRAAIASASATLSADIVDKLLDLEEKEAAGADSSSGASGSSLAASVELLLAKQISGSACGSGSVLVDAVLYPVLKSLASAATSGPAASSIISSVQNHASFASVQSLISGGIDSMDNFDHSTRGLLSSLKLLFSHAIIRAYPAIVFASRKSDDNDASASSSLHDATIARCANANFGDFQCNSAMAIAKVLKLQGYSGSCVPKDVAANIAANVPANNLLSKVQAVPNGFINITISTATIEASIAGIVSKGPQPPQMKAKTVVVDFSSPNIAKEMHVGHLRSTIIGDSICRILEFCGHNVLRRNHVGDWGTQFGMLITYLKDKYPDVLVNPPDISDLTDIYKRSKKRFDDEEAFKDRSRLAVVALQAGNPESREIWKLLCDVSRLEFQKVYDMLDIKLEEVGESFYNPFIPDVIKECEKVGIVKREGEMLIIMLPHFTIPLILRKSDGGYGYDSTDMAAIHYRLFEHQADWLIYITDAGQAPHFHMIFDAAKAAGWIDPVRQQRLDHIGFGVVCGDDGKRFKTRASETVKLIDLLNAAKDRMRESLQTRAEEGKSALDPAVLDDAARKIGFGAVKYFDLKQNPATNYIFSYDRMLDTRGDTAVYLMFAYARLTSILSKAEAERGVDMKSIMMQASSLLSLKEESERTLAFEIMQLGDVISSVLRELMPNRLCDYLQSVCVKFTEFVTKCHVLNSEPAVMQSRLVLIEGTRAVLAKCFELLGIQTPERI